MKSTRKTITSKAALDARDLEGPICNLAIMASIAVDLVEDASGIVASDRAKKLLFVAYQLQSMAADLKRDYYAAVYKRLEKNPAFRAGQRRIARAGLSVERLGVES
jgi:citrate lyase beta subunit